MVKADSQLKLLPIFILDIYKVFEHIDMLPICAVIRHTVAAFNNYTHTSREGLRQGGICVLSLS